MIVTENGVKITANEYAKFLVYDLGENADYFDDQRWSITFLDTDKLTDKDIEAIHERISHHQKRVYAYLGVNKIMKKLIGDD